MTTRFNSLLFTAILAFCTFQTKAQGFSVVMDSVLATPGQIICVPVRAHGFTNIGSFQYSLSWDPQVLTYDHTQNYDLPGWSALDFNGAAPNHLLVVWSHPQGLMSTKADGEILFQACFKVIGPLGSISHIGAGNEGFPPGSVSAEAFNMNGSNVWYAAGNVQGVVNVTTISVLGTSNAAVDAQIVWTLSPNPTSNVAQVNATFKSAGKVGLMVTDMQGKVVFEDNRQVPAGQQVFDIPAKALTAKGLYQVSLKTGQGVVSQVLTVQ